MKERITGAEIRAAKERDEAALASIIARQMPTIRRLARQATTPGLDFEDAVQEGLIGLFNAIGHYDESNAASFSTYASACIQNAILSARKAAGRKKHEPLNRSVPISDEQSIPGPEEETIANEQVSRTLEKAQAVLSRFEKEVLHYYLLGMSYDEIAQVLQKDTKAIDNALSRIRRKLK